MSDPVLHEASLVKILDCDCGVDNTSRLQAGALMSVLDAFDRKILREHYIRLVLAAFALHTQMAKTYVLNEVRLGYREHMHDADPVTFENALTDTYHEVTKGSADIHAELKRRVDLLVQCPTSQDQVH